MRSLILFRSRRVQGKDRIEPQSVPAVGQEVIVSERFLAEALAGFPNEEFYTNKDFSVTTDVVPGPGAIITIAYHNGAGTLRIDSVGSYADAGHVGPTVYYCTRLT